MHIIYPPSPNRLKTFLEQELYLIVFRALTFNTVPGKDMGFANERIRMKYQGRDPVSY